MPGTLTKIEGKLVNLQIATNLTTPVYKNVVCATDSSLDGTKNVNTLQTKCGTVKSFDKASWTAKGTGVANSTPGTDELSADEVLVLFQDSTPVLFKIAYLTTGGPIYRQGAGTFSAYSEKHGVSDNVTFDFTLEVDGDIDITE